MRWQLERALGYRFTHSFELKNTRGATLYHMIFATDHDAGTRIMESIYNNAAQRVPEMQKEACDAARGQLSLDIDVAAATEGYRYEPPWEPRPHPGSDSPKAVSVSACRSLAVGL